MKCVLTGFFDDKNQSFEDLMNQVIKHGIEYLALRTYQNQSLVELTDGDLKKIFNDAKSLRIKFSVLDTQIKSYDPYNDRKHQENVDTFKYLLKVSDKLKINHLFLRLPVIHDVIQEYDALEKKIGDYLDAANRAGKKIVILPETGYKINTYAYLLKKLNAKNLTIAFDPVLITMNNESPTTAYRLLRHYISVVFAHDANLKGEPELIGCGKSEMVKVLKRLDRDRFDGFIMVDHRFNHYVFKEEVVETNFFKRLFSQNKKIKEKRLRDLSKRIFPDEETKNVTEDDILDNQIKLIKSLFS